MRASSWQSDIRMNRARECGEAIADAWSRTEDALVRHSHHAARDDGADLSPARRLLRDALTAVRLGDGGVHDDVGVDADDALDPERGVAGTFGHRVGPAGARDHLVGKAGGSSGAHRFEPEDEQHARATPTR